MNRQVDMDASCYKILVEYLFDRTYFVDAAEELIARSDFPFYQSKNSVKNRITAG